jgi:hypothetical protein
MQRDVALDPQGPHDRHDRHPSRADIPPIGALALAWRGWERLQVDGIGSPQVILLGISAVLGAFVFAAMLRTRPPKEARGTSEASPNSLN